MKKIQTNNLKCVKSQRYDSVYYRIQDIGDMYIARIVGRVQEQASEMIRELMNNEELAQEVNGSDIAALVYAAMLKALNKAGSAVQLSDLENKVKQEMDRYSAASSKIKLAQEEFDPKNPFKSWALGNTVDTWQYKGNHIEIQEDIEYGPDGPENSKLWHLVATPDGRRLTAPISPYDGSRKIVELWIDAGYPEKCRMGNCEASELEQMIAEKSKSVPGMEDPSYFDITPNPFPS